MNLGARLNKALAKLLLEQHGKATDYSKARINLGEGGHGGHGDAGGRPSGASRPLVVQWTERFERLIESCEEDVRSLTHATGKVREFGGTKQAVGVRARLRDYEGRDPVYVAYHEGCSVELVRKLRRDSGLRVSDGAPMDRGERPLTAPARDSLQILQDAIGGEL